MSGILIFLALMLLGEFFCIAFHLPVPGAIIGMIILFYWLISSGKIHANVEESADTLLPLLPMFLVPAGVGVVAHFHIVQDEMVMIALVLILSTIIGIAVTATTLSYLKRIV